MESVHEFERDNFRALKRPQIIAALAVTLGGYGVGSICAWSAPAVPNLDESKHFGELSQSERTWISSCVPLGAFISGPFAGFIVDRFGRRLTILMTSIPFLLAWLTIAFAPSINVLIAARFITGLCLGTLSVATPMYIAEMAEEKIRGALSSLFPLMAALGILNANILGSFLDWFWLSLINGALVPIFLFGFVYFLPESPIFLLSKGRMEKARKALKWFRGAISSDQIEPELQQLRRSIDEKKDVKLSAKEFFSPSVIKPNLICLTLMFFQQMSGINAVIFYTVQIFKSADPTFNPNIASIIVGVVLLLSNTVSTFLIDKIGRRILLIVSDSGMAIGLFGLGLFFYLKDLNSISLGEPIDYCTPQNETATENYSVPESLGWLPLTSLMVFVASFNFGFGPIPFLYIGEILPSHVKGFGAGIAIGFCWFMAFLVIQSFEDFICHLGTYGCFWMFGVISTVGVLFCWLFCPETKGKTLSDIQRMFQ